MLPWTVILVSGLLGSSHCLGMCGPFAISIGLGSKNWRSNLARQLTYGIGRIFTYSFLGMAAGFGASQLLRSHPSLIRLPAWLALLAGVILVVQGLMTLQVIRLPRLRLGHTACLAFSFLKNLLNQPNGVGVFLAGIATGFLPCGLVYSFLALAASSAHLGYGALTMMLFGLGTLPAMILTGYGGTVLSVSARTRLIQIAALAVVLAGGLSISRGYSFLTAEILTLEDAQHACPYCTDEPATERSTPQAGP